MPDSGSWPLIWASALLAGALLGGVFFAGLWWTVRHAAQSPTPARWFIASLVVRTAIVLAGFYAMGAGHPILLGLCLLGFLLARVIVVSVTRPSSDRMVPPCA